MVDEPAQDRSTPRRKRTPVEEKGVAPAPLLMAMASLVLVLLVMSAVTGQWVFMFLGLFGVAAGALPFLNRRK